MTPAHPSSIIRWVWMDHGLLFGSPTVLLDSHSVYSVVDCCVTEIAVRMYSSLVAQLIMSPKLSVLVCRIRLRMFACPHAADTKSPRER